MFMLLCLGTIYAFYAYDGILFSNLRFENDVKMYGILPICRDLLQKA